MLLQRLATGANKQDTGEGAARHSYAHAQYLYTQPVYTVHYCVYGRSLALAVQCETTQGVYEFPPRVLHFSAFICISLVHVYEILGHEHCTDQPNNMQAVSYTFVQYTTLV